jgi:K(+)-stimulated pyrophosphate-energized sodium pump
MDLFSMSGYTLFEKVALWTVFGTSFIGIAYALVLALRIVRRDPGTPKMQAIAAEIQKGAKAYLNVQFRAILFLCVVMAALLFLTGENIYMQVGRSASFLLGAFFSGLVGFVGMSLAVRGNLRTAAAARRSYKEALTVAFQTGTIAGMFCVGIGLLGATGIFLIYGSHAYEVLIGFGFGGSLLALFMRVGGGIYTKAADIGADLVGKVEAGIPEDDPRNAAVIADNVGDNVGDCAGMAADIFESYEVTLVAAMILGYSVLGVPGVVFPLIVRGVGVITSIIGTLAVRPLSEKEHGMTVIQRGYIISAVTSAIGFFFFAHWYVGDMRVFWATVTGLVLSVLISLLTEHFTSLKRKPVKEIAAATRTGSATTVLMGVAVGLESSVWAILVICGAIFASVVIVGDPTNVGFILYSVSLAGMGMLTTTGVIVSMDTYGPVADNANGIIEMSKEGDEQTIKTIADLDAVGNTTKAITKGFAIATAVMAATSLFGSYFEEIVRAGGDLSYIDVASPMVLIGLLIGGAVPFMFSALTIRAVGRAAGLVIQEVRRQFATIPGLLEGKEGVTPDSGRAVAICTRAALRELVGPGLLAILTPLVVGFLFGAAPLGAFLAGIILTGQLMAVFLANSGGAWDNAKKSIEEGLYGGKGTPEHEAGVVGDTVGDPFKDTAGPAINPLIKVMNLVALIAAPLIIRFREVLWISAPLVAVGIILIGFAIWKSKRGTFGEMAESKPAEGAD